MKVVNPTLEAGREGWKCEEGAERVGRGVKVDSP